MRRPPLAGSLCRYRFLRHCASAGCFPKSGGFVVLRKSILVRHWPKITPRNQTCKVTEVMELVGVKSLGVMQLRAVFGISNGGFWGVLPGLAGFVRVYQVLAVTAVLVRRKSRERG